MFFGYLSCCKAAEAAVAAALATVATDNLFDEDFSRYPRSSSVPYVSWCRLSFILRIRHRGW